MVIMVIMIIFYVAILVLMIASGWKIYEKAGQPGWAAIVPIYNIIVLCKISDSAALYKWLKYYISLSKG